jgi:2-keto-4-pentenoate hydratase/2-oxohepta-3-ene-1,7-dioic acid hydratase in catechol pathway
MKLASYMVDGRAAFGVVRDGAVVTMGERLGIRAASLKDALSQDLIPQIAAAAAKASPDHKLADITFLPVIPDPELIACAGINYRSHASETGRDIPKQPSMFIRRANTLVAHEGEMIRPKVSTHFDFEGELAVVIGRGGRHVPLERALDHVAGYTCFVDGSVRDYQKFSVTAGKNFPGTGPLGPFLVTRDEIPDPTRLVLATRLNGTQMQRSGTDLLIYSIPQIITFCSDFTELSPGDVIATGTPEGVGHRRNPPLWMKAGDVLEVEITGIGTLRSRVVDEA